MDIMKITSAITAAIMITASLSVFPNNINDRGSLLVAEAANYVYPTGVTEEQIEQTVENFIAEHILPSMTDYEKMEEIMKFVSDGTYGADSDASGSYDVIVSKKGNCDAAAQAVKYICKKVGIPCYYRTAKYDLVGSADPWTASDHRNNVVQIDGVSYIADASSFGGKYTLTKVSDYKKFYSGTGKSDGQWVYRYSDEYGLILGEFLGFGIKNVEFPSTIGGYDVKNIYNIINWADKDSIESISIPDGMNIDSNTVNLFAGMKNLKTVHLGKDVSRLPEFCFENCNSLVSINLSDIKEYHLGCFAGCESVSETVVLDDKIEIVETGAFSGCKNATFVVADNFYSSYGFLDTAKMVFCSATSCVYNQCLEFNIPYTLTDNAVELKDCTVSVENVSYTGQELEPAVTVTDANGSPVSPAFYAVEYSNNVNVGTGSITITGDEAHAFGTRTLSFDINMADINDSNVTLDQSVFTYSGTSNKPVPTVVFNGTTLIKTTDYRVSYSNNTAAGTAKVVIKAIGNKFSGEKEIEFTILPQNLENADVSNLYSPMHISDTVQYPVVTLDGKTLFEGSSYTLSYSNVSTPGIATLTITGTGNYTGTINKTFSVIGTISNSTTTATVSSVSYTGSELTPNVTVKYGNTVLTKDSDYTITYSNNVNVGTGKFTITGKGFYEGTIEGTFSITGASIANANIAVDDQVYTGSTLTPVPVVTLNSKTLVKDTDYTVSYSNNINVGKATVTITGKGAYTGTASKDFNITGRSLGSATVTLAANEMAYNGSALKPAVTVKYGSSTLTQGTDYTVTYKNNVELGTANVIVTGIGGYTGEVTKSFTIYGQINSSTTTTASSNGTYTGNAITPEVTVKMGDITLVKNIDYTVSYSNNTNPGTATFTVTGKGDFRGTVSGTFTISKASIKGSSAKVTVSNDYVSYTGSEIAPSPTVVWNGKTLVKDVDYTLSYANNVNVGAATVYVTGIGNFTGTNSAIFSIVAQNLSSATATLSSSSYTYTGSAFTPSVTVKIGDKTLVKDTDYTVNYADNTNPGTATVTITGKGNYTGSIQNTFSIASAEFAGITVSGLNAVTYSGKAYTPSITVKIGSKTLVNGTDYTVEYKDNVNAGQASVVITGQGNYAGSVTKQFIIAPYILTDDNIVGLMSSVTFNGEHTETNVLLKNGTTTLVKGTDYEISYLNNNTPGIASIVITGTGNYAGTLSVPYTIYCEHSYEDTVIAPTCEAGGYTVRRCSICGEESIINQTEALGHSYVLKESVPATNEASGYELYECEHDHSHTYYKILPRLATSISDATVTIKNPTYTYTGNYITPDNISGSDDISVKVGTTTLVKNVDYTISYENNAKIGKATVIIKGIGTYVDEVRTSFVIIPTTNSITSLITVNGGISVYWKQNSTATGYQIVYDKSSSFNSANYHSTSVTDPTKLFVNLTSQPKAGETWYVKVRSYVEVDGVRYGTYSSAKAILVKGNVKTVTIPYSSYTYTGGAIKPAVTVKDSKGNTIPSSGYTVSYKSNTAVGTATITITGRGSYQGTITKNFTIKPQKTTLKSSTCYTNAVVFNWNASPTGDGVVLYRYNTSTKQWVRVAKLAKKTTAYTFSGLTAGTSYQFAMRTYKTVNGTEILSDQYTYTRVTKLPNVTGVTFTNNYNNSVMIKWNKVSGAQGYYVYRYNSSTGKWVLVKKTTNTNNSLTVSGLTAGTTYRFYVKAYKNVNGTKVQSRSYTSYTTSTRPAQVSVTVRPYNGWASLSWNRATGATGYIVYYKASANGSWIRATTTTYNYYNKWGLGRYRYYWFAVQPYRVVNGKYYYGTYQTYRTYIR